MEKEVTLVKCNGKPVSIGVGKFCFSVENGIVTHNESSRIGSQVKAESGNVDAIKHYNEAFELAVFAWETQMFDGVEENTFSA